MRVFRFYRRPGLSSVNRQKAITKIQSAIGQRGKITNLDTELCFYFQIAREKLTKIEKDLLMWIVAIPFEDDLISGQSYLREKCMGDLILEVGPRMNFSTAFSTNAISICSSIGLMGIVRIEQSIRYLINIEPSSPAGYLSMRADENEVDATKDDCSSLNSCDCHAKLADSNCASTRNTNHSLIANNEDVPRSVFMFSKQSANGTGSCSKGLQTSGITGFTELRTDILAVLHDRMTQCCYYSPILTFDLDILPDPVYEIDVMGVTGREALVKANNDLGLAFDSWDLDYYTSLFRTKIQRNPTSVECFDLAQSNSEHSRHWFFRGRFFIDGVEMEESLLKMVMNTQKFSNQNNVIKFSDNSSSIEGGNVTVLRPIKVSLSSPFESSQTVRHLIFTAETHNFPTGSQPSSAQNIHTRFAWTAAIILIISDQDCSSGVAPFPGATTGTGGRIRDVQAAGRGAHVIAGTAGYCFGNLLVPGCVLPWEDTDAKYSETLASPLDIAIEASNGASDYGNKFGEPIIAGFSRSFGLILPDGERREWIKPIMFTGGIGSISSLHVNKETAQPGMDVIKIGGPVYRIGVGGGAASSVLVQGDGRSDLDFGAVQRGDAEMEQKMNRVVRACIELESTNPICSIHDQGAGGNGNVLKEICYPSGALIKASGFQLGDDTLSILELWGAEYQESNALLARPKDCQLLREMAAREKCPISFVGAITCDGKIRLEDDRKPSNKLSPDAKKQRMQGTSAQFPVDLDLETILGDMPRKEYRVGRKLLKLHELELPFELTVIEALHRVLRLPSVASKRYLTNKVDRSVTGLIAQQQCVGPLHTPLADVAVVALSHFDKVGGATSIGEQPIKCLVNSRAGARMTVGEALTNLVFAPISALKDVKCSANWMWPAKQVGEDSRLYDACSAMCEVMAELGIAVDGGKDSLSMAARVSGELVKSPGSLVVSTYAFCPDITAIVTPDLKCPNGKGTLVYVPLSLGKHRLGGSALAQCYKQIGEESPDLDSSKIFIAAFTAIQKLIKENLIVSGHDISDGGLITACLEMAFAGNCSIDVWLPPDSTEPDCPKVPILQQLFAEELGFILEIAESDMDRVLGTIDGAGVHCYPIGHSYMNNGENKVLIKVGDVEALQDTMANLRDIWEATSFQLEHLQANSACVKQEERGLRSRRAPQYHLTFDPEELFARTAITDAESGAVMSTKPKVAVVREEGSNGDREMVAVLHMAGFEVWDVNMHDLCMGEVNLQQFRGVVFVGGFSYADVFGSAKGWAATLKYNDQVRCQFDDFYSRSDTFSLGVCNGCQLMALLGWVGVDEDNKENGKGQGVLLTHNESERFESRFVTVRIMDSPSIMLKGMSDSVLGVWVAHGEGRFVFKNDQILAQTHLDNLVALKYADDDGQPTCVYPLNPNGSPDGIAGLCSADGRHLAIMPHPERCFLPWQWPWMPNDMARTMRMSPWLCMFKNAYNWCIEVPSSSFVGVS